MEENYSYLHFTSNEAFESIIRSRTLRLYNYESLSDKFEISLPLIEILKEICNVFTGHPNKIEKIENNALLFFVLCNFINFRYNELQLVDYKIVIDDILKTLTEKQENTEHIYKQILDLTKSRNYIKNDNLGLYIISLCGVEQNIIKNYLTKEANIKYNKDKNDITSRLRFFSDIELGYLWDKYGKYHSGIALKFENNFLNLINDSKLVFKNVNYNTESIIDYYYFKENNKNYFDIKEDIVNLNNDLNNDLKNEINAKNLNGILNNFDEFKSCFYNKKNDFYELEINYTNKLTNLINSKIPFLKLKHYENEKEFRLSVTKNVNTNIDNFKTDPERNTTYYELDFKDIFTKENPLEVIIGYRNEKFLNTSYRETFQREFPFVKFLM